MARKKIAVIGIGKISQDQHLPVIEKSRDFELAACVSTRGVGHRDVPVFRTAAELYGAMPDVGIVSICTPPSVRHTLVREALAAGKDVLMEKPPTQTISELDDLVAHARKKDRVLFQTWHSRYNEAVAAGADPDFGRTHLPLPLERGPFYAIRNHGISLVTFAGLDIDSDLRVRRTDGTPIPGLYAIGEVIGAAATCGQSFCSGMLVTPAITFGRLLGRRLAASAGRAA